MSQIDFNIGVAGYSIRPVAATDARAVRMLLPELQETSAVFVAVDNWRQRVIGAAAATRKPRRQPIFGIGIAITVIEPCRGYGVARGMLTHLEDAARVRCVQAFYGAKRADAGSDKLAGWRRLGFTPCEKVEEHLLPLAEFEPRLAPLLVRFQRQGRIPQSANIVPLYRSNLSEVLQLHLDCMGGDRGVLFRKLRSEGAGAFHPRYSRVLTIDGRTLGCILAHRADQETAVVDANILDPRLRGGWANVWLKLEATRGAMSLGIKNFRFTTFDHYADTRSFTEKLGGTTTRTSYLMMRPIQLQATSGSN